AGGRVVWVVTGIGFQQKGHVMLTYLDCPGVILSAHSFRCHLPQIHNHTHTTPHTHTHTHTHTPTHTQIPVGETRTQGLQRSLSDGPNVTNGRSSTTGNDTLRMDVMTL